MTCEFFSTKNSLLFLQRFESKAREWSGQYNGTDIVPGTLLLLQIRAAGGLEFRGDPQGPLH